MSDASQNILLQAPSPLVDIGVNLTSDRYKVPVSELIEQALAANVQTLILTGTSVNSSQAALDLCNLHREQLYCTAGIHPHDASEATPEALQALNALIAQPACVAVGETGLDFNRNFSAPEQQEQSFEAHLELAISHQKPLFLHERDAFERQFQILKSYRDQISDLVIHCFTGHQQALFSYLDLDCYIGITGWICDERRGTELQQLVHNIPQDRLLIETDAPYLLPRNMQPKPKDRLNRPAYLPWVLRMISQQRQQDEQQLAEITTDNARRFFRLPDNHVPDNRSAS